MDGSISDVTRILVAGDVHGNTKHMYWLIATAVSHEVKIILQLGDFGAWEHTEDGRKFFNDVNRIAKRNGVTIVFICGNHDKTSLLLSKYGSKRDEDGFLVCRSNLRYIPRGTVWTWGATRFLAFGGAYSVDKEWRLDLERQRREKWEYKRSLGSRQRDTSSGYFWFPEEEASEEEFLKAMGDGSRVDVMVTHDKPRGSNPRWNRKDYLECLPNQDRIQALLQARTPSILLHGHLHYPYEDRVRHDGGWCLVKGLDADYAEHPGYNPRDSFVLLDVSGKSVDGGLTETGD